ncbi:transglutaminase-like cysteine peptidase [Tistlia consotensis]|nr:transglutaminase-like cysteine peptidase [Tistlia consotensis]
MTAVPMTDASAWRLFGRDAVRVPNGIGQYAIWSDVVRRARVGGSPAWQRIIERVQRRGGGSLFHLVCATNAILNDIPYRSDEARFRVRDRWLDPDSFVTFGGDCEDFAIAKYFLLRRLGVTEDGLRLVTGVDADRVSGHALLAVKLDDEVLVLDNRYRWPQPQDQFPSFRPQLSFNETDLWLYR